MPSFDIATLDSLLIQTCKDLNTTIITFPLPETSFNVLRDKGVAKPAHIKFKTMRTGKMAGYIILDGDQISQIPAPFKVKTHEGTSVLVDQHNRYVTSDLDLLTVIAPSKQNAEPYLDGEYGLTTPFEKIVILSINDAVKQHGVDKIITHGSLLHYKKPNSDLIKWPLHAYTPHQKQLIHNVDELNNLGIDLLS